MRRLFSLLGWLVFSAIVAATVIVIAIDVGFQRDRLRDAALSIVRDELGLEVAVDRVDGRASRGLELHGVRIGPEAAPLAEIDRVRAEWRIWRWLLDDELRIERIEVERARLSLERDADGRWRTLDDVLDRLADRQPPAPAADAEALPPILVRRLAIRDSQIALTATSTDASDPNDGAEGADRIVFAVEAEATGIRPDTEVGLPVERADLELELVEAMRVGSTLPALDAARIIVGLTAEGGLSTTLEARGPGLTLDATVEGTTGTPGPVRFALRVDDLGSLARWVPRAENLLGRARIEGELEGFRLDAPTIFERDALDGRLTVDAAIDGLPPIRGRSLPPGLLEIQARARVDAGRILVEGATLSHARGLQATLSGTASQTHLEDASVAARVEDLGVWTRALLPEVEDLRGRTLELTADLDGPIDAPSGAVVVNARGLTLGDLAPTDLAVSLRRNGTAPARLHALAWATGSPRPDPRAPSVPLRIEAEIDPVGRRATFGAAFDGTFVSQSGAVPTPFSGAFTLDGRTEAEGDGLRVEAQLRGEEVIVDTTSFGSLDLAGRTRAPATPDRIEVDLTRLETGTGSARFPRIRLERPASLTLEASQRWKIDDLAFALDFEDEGTVESVSTDFDAEGPVESGSTDGGPNPGAAIVLTADGRAGTPDSVALVLRALPIEAITAHLEAPPPLSGRLSLEARLDARNGVLFTAGEGTIEAPTLAARSFDDVSLSWETNEEAKATLSRLVVQMAAATPIEIEARLPLVPSDPERIRGAVLNQTTFVAKLDGFDLALLAPAIPRTLRDPAGELRGRLEGRLEDGRPRLSGRLEVADAGITVPLLRRRFAPLDGLAVLDESRLELRELRLGDDEAGARLTGFVDLAPDAGLPIDAELALLNLPVSRSPLLHADVDGRLSLSGSLARPKIEGRLTLPGVRVRVPAAQDPLLREIRLTAAAGDALVESAPGADDFVTSSFIDVEFEVPEGARIRGQGAHLYVKGNARIASRPGEALRVFGEGEVVNGTYTLQGRRFQVRRGSVRLVGDREVDPVLDVEARLPTGDIVAIVDVTGRLSSPIVRLRSEPERSEQDVLAYLIFGRPADEVGASQSGAMDAAAARLVAGVAERELRELLGDAMPVDSIEIGADDEGNTSELGFGKYLQPNLYLRYVHVLGDEPADRVGVEYRVNDLISVGSSVSTTGDAGLDLILRHDF
ncbi:MAG: translocation/assembly module TamB domain-containing protein [bacterium]|nr:translocation/assembly module TamB domain-containing protein [bacterium]